MSPARATRRGLLAGLVAGLLVALAGVFSRSSARGRARAAWPGFRRVRPWSDDQLHRPHDRAG